MAQRGAAAGGMAMAFSWRPAALKAWLCNNGSAGSSISANAAARKKKKSSRRHQ